MRCFLPCFWLAVVEKAVSGLGQECVTFLWLGSNPLLEVLDGHSPGLRGSWGKYAGATLFLHSFLVSFALFWSKWQVRLSFSDVSCPYLGTGDSPAGDGRKEWKESRLLNRSSALSVMGWPLSAILCRGSTPIWGAPWVPILGPELLLWSSRVPTWSPPESQCWRSRGLGWRPARAGGGYSHDC
jgi:hypothetical protein